MTAEERSAEIESSAAATSGSAQTPSPPRLCQQLHGRTAGRRRLIKIAITGNDPPPTMTFIVMTYIFPASF